MNFYLLSFFFFSPFLLLLFLSPSLPPFFYAYLCAFMCMLQFGVGANGECFYERSEVLLGSGIVRMLLYLGGQL